MPVYISMFEIYNERVCRAFAYPSSTAGAPLEYPLSTLRVPLRVPRKYPVSTTLTCRSLSVRTEATVSEYPESTRRVP